MRRTLQILLVAAAALYLVTPGVSDWQAGASEGGARGGSARQVADDSAALDARVVELNAAKKGLEGALVAKKKQDEERYKKMIKIYKGLKADQAGALLNKLDDKMVIEMLNQMDQKTAVKLIPFINQPRVLEWTRLNLQGN